MNTERSLVEEIRAASRSMARDWGFMGSRFAGVELPPSAVHGLIEIDAGAVSAGDLGTRLRLEKSSVSRMLRKLVEAGDVVEAVAGHDSRIKLLSLTAAGRRRVAAIHAHARAQVTDALGRLPRDRHRTVLDGLRLYSVALAGGQGSRPDPYAVEVVPGYQLGLLARITQLHALHYGREAGFGQRFESAVAAGLADFCDRLDRPGNGLWSARQGGGILGSAAIDGDGAGDGVAHLRWFVVDGAVDGGSVAHALLAAALDFADNRGFAETDLWAVDGATGAWHPCELHGFTRMETRPDAQWGREVLLQRFTRRRP